MGSRKKYRRGPPTVSLEFMEMEGGAAGNNREFLEISGGAGNETSRGHTVPKRLVCTV